MRKAAVPFIMLTALLDIVGIGLIIPVTPLLVGELAGDRGAQVFWYNALLVSFGAAQFLCAPLLGALSDRFGRRPVLLLGISGLGCTFLVTGLANSLWVLLAVRVLGGALSANIAVAQAYVADITAPGERTAALGKLGAMFGLGFVLGPVLGGLLGHVSLRLPFFAAAALCLINGLYGLLVLPESLPPERRSREPRTLNPFAALSGLAQLHGVGPLVGAIIAANLAQFILQSAWVLYTSFRFHWGALENGLSLFTVGMVAVIVQGGLMKPLLRSLGEQRLIVLGLASGTAAYALYGLVDRGALLYAVIVANFLAFASTTALQGLVSKAAPPDMQGQTMASLTALSSLASILAPVLGGALLSWGASTQAGHLAQGAPFFASALLEAFAWWVMRRHFTRAPAPAAAVTGS